jgi:hypothetical protein
LFSWLYSVIATALYYFFYVFFASNNHFDDVKPNRALFELVCITCHTVLLANSSISIIASRALPQLLRRNTATLTITYAN